MDFEILTKEAKSIIDKTNKDEYVTVFLTDKGNIYTEIANFTLIEEYSILKEMIAKEDTRITKILCVFKQEENICLERPSDCNCRAMRKINSKNVDAEVLVQGYRKTLVQTIGNYLDYPTK